MARANKVEGLVDRLVRGGSSPLGRTKKVRPVGYDTYSNAALSFFRKATGSIAGYRYNSDSIAS
jgi:hypothetical protein